MGPRGLQSRATVLVQFDFENTAVYWHFRKVVWGRGRQGGQRSFDTLGMTNREGQSAGDSRRYTTGALPAPTKRGYRSATAVCRQGTTGSRLRFASAPSDSACGPRRRTPRGATRPTTGGGKKERRQRGPMSYKTLRKEKLPNVAAKTASPRLVQLVLDSAPKRCGKDEAPREATRPTTAKRKASKPSKPSKVHFEVWKHGGRIGV